MRGKVHTVKLDLVDETVVLDTVNKKMENCKTIEILLNVFVRVPFKQYHSCVFHVLAVTLTLHSYVAKQT